MNNVARLLAGLSLSATVAIAAPASAEVVIGTTTGGPTYNRLVTLTTLSSVGTAVRYQTQAFTVSTAGSYTFVLTATGFDPFLTLYAGSFNPASPTTNALALNDDLVAGNLTQSGFVQALTAGTSYFAVATGFANTDFGPYTLSIAGPGRVTFGTTPAVPEPASWALMIGGIGAIGLAMRRRQKVRTSVTFA